MHGEFAAYLKELEKSVDSGSIAPVVAQDLETEAHLTLWRETDANQLTALKLLPSVSAKQIRHEYALVVDYNTQRRITGGFGERSLPAEGRGKFRRMAEIIKLTGLIMPTYLLASLETTITALDANDPVQINAKLQRLDHLKQKNHDIYFSDSTVIRQGSSGNRCRGLIQQIREGTDGTGIDADGNTLPASPFGSHVIDMEGQPLNLGTIREKAADILTLFGRMTCLIGDQYMRTDFEASFDGDRMHPTPIATEAYMMGQNVAGLQTNGNITWFETDLDLTPAYAQGKYSATLSDDAPRTRPTVTASVASHSSSKFNAADAADLFWMITETKDQFQGLGTRYPATGYTSVGAGDRVTFSITPGDPTADSFRVHRGTSADAADTDAWFIFEVANSGSGGAVTVYDTNAKRPNTSVAFGLNIRSQVQKALHTANANGLVGNYESVRATASTYLNQPDDPASNTVAIAHLGPQVGVMELAAILATAKRPLMYSAWTPLVRNPFQNVVFENIGRLR